MQICDPSIAEIMSNANYDWITFRPRTWFLFYQGLNQLCKSS